MAAKIGNTFKVKFDIFRIIEDRLINSELEFSADLIVDDQATPEQQVTALSNIRKWFDIVLDKSLAYFIGNEIPFCTIENLSNNLMFCPDEPYDHLLLVLIVAKINAIGSKFVTVNRCNIHSNLGEGFGNSFEGDPLELLPPVEDWLGEVRYFEQPWWNRSDGGMIDSWVGEDDDPLDIPDILIDLSDDNENELKLADIISPFKPVIITNDQLIPDD